MSANGVLISYREDDSSCSALRLADELVEAFGAEQVFLEKDTQHAEDWREQFSQALNRCKVVLVIIGRKWAAATDESGRHRVDSSADVHRQAICLALARDGVTVIPVQVEEASLPRPEELPEDLKPLTEQRTRELSEDRARRAADLKRLVEDIERATGLQAKPAKDGKAPQSTATGSHSMFSGSVLITTAVVSIVLLAVVDLAIGWTLNPGEKSFIVLLVFVCTLTVSRWRHRHKQG